MFGKFADNYKEFVRIIHTEVSESEEQRAIILNTTFIFKIILGVTLLLMSYLNYRNSEMTMFFTTFAGGIISIVFGVIGKILNNRRVMTVGVSIVICLLFTLWAIIGGNNGFALIWLTLIPFSCMFSFGIVHGTLVSLYFVVLMVILFYTPIRNIIGVNYSEIFMDRFPFLYTVGIVASFIGVYRLHKTNIENEFQKKELNRLRVQAEEANQVKSSFLANMFHEIRTPINVVLGMNELILRESPNEEITEYAESIESSGRILLSLINDILDFSKVESGKMSIVPAEYYFSEVINDLVIMTSSRAEEKGLKFDIDVEGNIPSILYGDELRIKQIVMNLLTNAVKYTEEGKIILSVKSEDITTQPSERRKCRVLFSVTDTGKGIKEEDLPMLFDAFLRLDQQQNRHIEGTGLGLSLSRTFAKMMNGDVEVKSIYGKGTEFTVSIIQDIVDADPIGDYTPYTVEKKKMRVERGTTINAEGVSILVVDDVFENCQVIKGLLKESGATIDFALSGENSVEMCEQKKYDLIFMDHMMYGMDGVEAFLRIRAGKTNKTTPVIALTANALAGMKEKYESMGFDGFLAKPVIPSKLDEIIFNTLPDKVSLKKQNLDVISDSGEEGFTTEEKAIIEKIKAQIPDIEIYDAIEKYAISFEFYKKLANGVVESDRIDYLCQAFESREYDKYRLEAHSLKGLVKSIGLYSLSELFENLQKACDEKNYQYIEENHERVVDIYDDSMDKIAMIMS